MKIRIPSCPRHHSTPLLLGLSGGLDSIALLSLLATDPDIGPSGLHAIHVHHGLQPQADAWAKHCEQACAEFGVPMRMIMVTVDRHHEQGPEAAARQARYDAFKQALRPDQVLITAHHLEDQAETFLLRALRASGPDGLAAMRPWRRFANAWHWRPLLDVSRQTLLAYARSKELRWIEDPSNDSHDYDRNFLRHRILPLLSERWPKAAESLAQSASLSADASDLLFEQDAELLEKTLLPRDHHTLCVSSLQALPRARRARVLRYWLRHLGLPPLPATGVVQLESNLLAARADSVAAFTWSGASIRRWRNFLHADWLHPRLPADWRTRWDGRSPLPLPDGGMLSLLDPAGRSSPDGFDVPLYVHGRHGGERIVLPGRRHSHSLKHVLQKQTVPPWQREHLPLLSDQHGQLLAAGSLVISAVLSEWLALRTLQLSWVTPSHP